MEQAVEKYIPKNDIETISGSLEFSHIKLNPAYAAKWNETSHDFVHLTNNGRLISNTLYRKGGIGGKFEDGYCLLLKYTEDFYDDSITKASNKKRHLKSEWCIIDMLGNEKIVFNQFETPYLTGGQVYSIKNKYYNILTGYLYCESYSCLKSQDFIFLENTFDEDVSKRGVLKINKHTGNFELFK